MIRRHCMMAIAVALVTLTAFAQQQPNLEKGFQPGKMYQFGDTDNVNLFNGNLNVVLPLGMTYPVGGNLSYGLGLAYGGNSWLHRLEIVYTTIDNVYGPYDQSWTDPAPTSNAGFGWVTGFGAMFPAQDALAGELNEYCSPDGARHAFADRLHETDTVVADVSYTRDGSYLRRKVLSRNYLGAVTSQQVEFPDGTTKEFDSLGRLTRWYDKFSNEVDVEYDVAGATPYSGSGTTCGSSPMNWKITDTTGRTQYLFFRSAPSYSSFGVLCEANLMAFGGATAVYKLGYADRAISRQDVTTDIPPVNSYSGAYHPTNIVSVPLLTSVTLPDLSTYTFKYDIGVTGTTGLNSDSGSTPDALSAIGSANPGSFSGSLSQLKLPTGAVRDYTYKSYAFPTAIRGTGGSPPFNSKLWRSQSSGLLKRTETISSSLQHITDYTSTAIYNVAPGNPNRYQVGSRTEVVESSGSTVISKARHYFSVCQTCTLGDYNNNEYGLPLLHTATADGVSPALKSDDRYLSTVLLSPSDVTLRTTYVRYESDAIGNEGAGHFEINRRVAASTVIDPTDGIVSKSTSSDFDGYGHYRTTTTTGFSGLTRTSTVNYNRIDTAVAATGPNTGTYPTAFTAITPSSAWVLGTYTSQTATDGASTVKTLFDFDPSTGFLRGQRVLTNGSTAGTHDLLTKYTQTGGNVTKVQQAGGDDATLPTTALSGVSPTWSFQMDHTYSKGTLETSRYYDVAAGAALTFLSVDNTVDATGLVSSSRDSAGVETTFVFDTSGRQTSVTPTGRASSSYAYVAATGNTLGTFTPASASSTTTSTAGGNIEAKVVFDSLGRPVRSAQRMPDGNWTMTETTYDALGRVVLTSEPQNIGTNALTDAFTASLTTAFTYDSLGRRLTVTPPEGSTHVSSTTYTGAKLVQRTSKIATSSSAETASDTVEEYDDRGQLIRVTQNSGPTSSTSTTGASATTRYQYDVAGHLTSVAMQAATGGVVQNRIFDYDGRGFLRWESHPESGMATYTYDARGSVLSKTQSAANSQFDLKYDYDAAGRLRHVTGRNPLYVYGNSDPRIGTQFRPIKEFTYATANDTTLVAEFSGSTALANLKAGKLETAIRYNYPPKEGGCCFPYLTDTVVRVTETYRYRDVAGRRSGRTTLIETGNSPPTAVSWATVSSVEQAAEYNDLDLVTRSQYPMCLGCGAPDGPHPDRTAMTSSYSRGRISTIAGFVTSTDYWPNGMRKQLLHSNGIVDKQVLDMQVVDGSGNVTNTAGLSRPAVISSALYDSCSAPRITASPVGGSLTTSITSFVLTVTATDADAYQWYTSNNQPISGATASSYTASPSVTTSYYVIVSGTCNGVTRTVTSATARVSVNECTAPTAGTPSATLNPSGTVTLRAYATGTQPYTFNWYLTGSNTFVGTGASFTTAVISSPTSWYFTVSNSCGGSPVSSTSVAITPLSAPGITLTATLNSSNQVQVTWGAATGVSEYRLIRRGPTGTTVIADHYTGTSYLDTSVTSGNAYAYQVEGLSNVDVATVMTFTPAVAYQPVLASQFNGTLAGVNALRATVGWAGLNWSDILSSKQPLPEPNALITSAHIAALRARMNEALQALGVKINGYTDPDPSHVPIKALHLNEIQERAQ